MKMERRPHRHFSVVNGRLGCSLFSCQTERPTPRRAVGRGCLLALLGVGDAPRGSTRTVFNAKQGGLNGKECPGVSAFVFNVNVFRDTPSAVVASTPFLHFLQLLTAKGKEALLGLSLASCACCVLTVEVQDQNHQCLCETLFSSETNPSHELTRHNALCRSGLSVWR